MVGVPSSPERGRSKMSVTPHAAFVFLLGIVWITSVAASDAPPAVRIDSGLVAGVRVVVGGKQVDAYLGIPYAKPPVGDLRFRKPLPVSPWRGVYNATSKPKACKQLPLPLLPNVKLDYANASEDCLYVNVWKPASVCTETPCKAKVPVFVFIHGGGFQWGDSALFVYDLANFAALTDVVVVSFNYRVGIHGFLSLDAPAIPGNMGLWDQHLLLKWVQRNIASFGGDPKEVTLGGQSAGSTSVGLHAISPHSKGLFKRVIMQSGGPLSMVATIYFRGEGKFINAASALGCYDSKKNLAEQQSEVLACLRRLDPAFIINKVEKFEFTQQMFVPLDKDEFLPFSILTPEPWKKISVGEVLLGSTANEATMFLSVMKTAFPQLVGMMENQYRMLSIIVMAQTLNIPVSTSKEIVRAYFGDDSQEHNQTQVWNTLSEMLGDAIFDCPVQLFADSASGQGVKTYRYVFGYRPTHSVYEEWMGVAHGEDLLYTLGSLPFIGDKSRYVEAMGKTGMDFMDSSSYTPKEEHFMREVVAAWGSFIKTGKPTIPRPGVDWKDYGRGTHPILLLRPENYTTIDDKKRKQCAMWRPILYRDEHEAVAATTMAPSTKPTKPGIRKVTWKPKPSFSSKENHASSSPAVLPIITVLIVTTTTIFLVR